MPKVIAPEALIKSSGLVLFLGAGASADFDIPVTSALKEEFLEKYPSRKKFFSALGSVLESFRSPNDIEQILALCKSLADPLEAIRLGGPYAVFLRSRTRSMSFAHDLRARRLARRIESFLVERCRLPNIAAKAKAVDVYTKFWARLIDKHHLRPNFSKRVAEAGGRVRCPYIEVFTTNYDNVLEEYCRTLGIDCRTGYVELTGGYYRYDPSDFAPNTLHLYKLHGSVELTLLKGGRLRRTPFVMKLGDKYEGSPAISYGLIQGAEKYVASEPYLDYLMALKNALRRARKCIAVGYSFSDDNIRKIFEDSLRGNPRLRIELVSKCPRKIRKRLSGYSNRIDCTRSRFERYIP